MNDDLRKKSKQQLIEELSQAQQYIKALESQISQQALEIDPQKIIDVVVVVVLH